VALANAQVNGMMQFQLYPEAYHAFDAASGIEKPTVFTDIWSHTIRQQPLTPTSGCWNFFIGICTDTCRGSGVAGAGGGLDKGRQSQ
jgi:hypothetical protein